MQSFRVLGNYTNFLQKQLFSSSAFAPTPGNLPFARSMSMGSVTPAMTEFVDYLDNLKNYEKVGVPRNAGTESDDGFDLGRMRRLMKRLGNPHLKYKVVHIAGTKGKGSAAAYLSNILRAEGYSVGCYTSPHLQTIRERMTLGSLGLPVSEDQLLCLFHRIRKILDQAVEFECGCLSHFEVLTAIAFALFAQHKIDIAVVEAGLGGARDATNIIDSSVLAASVITTIGEEHMAALGGSLESIAMAKSGIIKYGCPVVLGGPFLPHIEQIIRNYASSMSSPVISAVNSRNRISIQSLGQVGGKPVQICDIVIQSEEISSSMELLGVNLPMLGGHQLQNAATATCAALCLRNQGWRISDGSFRRGLAYTKLLGRSQFLTAIEAERLGLPGSTILLDGAHTRDSAKALQETIHMAIPKAKIVLVVAMASDKDHAAFAKELLSGLHLEAVFLTEVDVAGNKSRTTSALSLRDTWIKASKEQVIDINSLKLVKDQENLPASFVKNSTGTTILAAESSLTAALRFAYQILRMRAAGDQLGTIVVTGSLHIVSSVLASTSS